MKKLLSIFLAVCILFGMLPGIFVSADIEAEHTVSTKKDGNIRISGYALSGKSGINVSLMVFPEGGSSEDLPEEGSVLGITLYYNQVKTSTNGYFEFVFGTELEEGKAYEAEIRVADEADKRHITFIKNNVYYGFTEDFESYTGGIPTDWSVYRDLGAAAVVDDDHGTSYYKSFKTDKHYMYRSFDDTLSDGVYKLSFDYMSTGTEIYGYEAYTCLVAEGYDGEPPSAPAANEDYLLESFVARTVNVEDEEGNVTGKTSYLTYSAGTSEWSLGTKKTYEANTWYTITAWYDLNNNKVYYYVDDEFLGSTSVQDTDMIGVCFVLDSNKTLSEDAEDAGVYIDNISFREYLYDERIDIENIPEQLTVHCDFEIKSDNPGNIFFDDETAQMYVEAINRKNVNDELDYIITVTDEDGNELWSFTDTTENEVEPYGTERIYFTPENVDKYGIYKLIATVTDSFGNAVTETSEFSRSVESKRKNDKVGTNTHIVNVTRGDANILMPLIAKAGLGFTRDVWSLAWPDKSKYTAFFERRDRYVNLSQSLGLGMLPILSLTRSDYLEEGKSLTLTEEGLQEVYNYTYDLAEDFSGVLEYVEVINEPNEKDSTATEIEGYVDILKQVYNGIKDGVQASDAQEDIKVMGFSLSYNKIYDYLGTAISDYDANEYMDAVSFHPYWSKGKPEVAEISNFKQLPSWADYVKKVKAVVNDDSKELWATETGWFIGGQGDGLDSVEGDYDFYVDEDRQAALIVRETAINEITGYLDKIIFYDFMNDGTNSTDKEHNFGMLKTWRGVDTPYAAKKSYLAMANYNNLLAGAEFIKHTIDDRDPTVNYDNPGKLNKYDDIREDNVPLYNKEMTYDVTFHRPDDGADVHMVWAVNGTVENVQVDVGDCDTVLVYDMVGNATECAVTDGIITLTATEEPMYVEVGGFKAELKVGDTNIQKISQLKNGDEVTVNVTSDIENMVIVVAKYTDEGRLSEKSEISEEKSFDFTFNSATKRIKIFFWNNMQDLIPLYKHLEIN